MNQTAQLTQAHLDEMYQKLISCGAEPKREGPPQFYFYLVQYRFPRSKKRRIRRKWAKDYWRNYRVSGSERSMSELLAPFGKEEP